MFPVFPASIPNATADFAVNSVKRPRSRTAIPACPASAMMSASPDAAIGMRLEMSSTSLRSFAKPSGEVSTTFLTSAIELSKFIAAPIVPR